MEISPAQLGEIRKSLKDLRKQKQDLQVMKEQFLLQATQTQEDIDAINAKIDELKIGVE